jgi:hypothetical protein
MLTRQDFTEIIGEIQYKDWGFYVGYFDDNLSAHYLQVAFFADGEEQKGRKWHLSPYMTKSEVVSTALKAVLTAEEHEAREAFRYKNKRIFGPHFDVDILAEIAGKKANLDIREPVSA